MEKLNLSWHAFEFEHKQKTPDWYWAVSLISVCIIATSVFYQNYLFSVFIFLASIILLFKANQTPKILTCEINNRGIVLDKYLFPYSTIEAFWLDVDESGKELHRIFIRTNKHLSPLITIPANNQDPEEIHTALSRKIKEEKMEEHQLINLMKHLGF